MSVDTEPLQLHVQTLHATTDWPFSDVAVEAMARDRDIDRVVASGRSDDQGLAVLELEPGLAREPLTVAIAGDGERVPVTRAMLTDAECARLVVTAADEVEPTALVMLADHLVATRRVLAGDVAGDLSRPAPDSMVRALSPRDRARLLVDLLEAVGRDAATDVDLDNSSLIDPDAVRAGALSVVSPTDVLIEQDGDLEIDRLDPDHIALPRPRWDVFEWALPDDQSYRDYLRGVFVLFAHQQQSGASTDASAFPDVVDLQLQRRFFQDFRTTDRTETPLNRLLIPIVTAILTSPTGSGFGFGVPSASIPTPGDSTAREHLDALLQLAPVPADEFGNRYRLPVREPDSTISSPVLLNVHTLSGVLSDTAQGPVEPPENAVEPQLPGAEGKPILWSDVVGSAPFFLRFDEWLTRQRPFFAENLFALRTQVNGAVAGPWLNEDRKKFLEFHKTIPATQSLTRYQPYFSTIGEVHRSATFLLEYGAADVKLTELVQAIDRSQFTTADRLVDEAARLLDDASFTPATGENWEPEESVGNFPRPLSLDRRRALKVATITELTGTRTTYPPNGFERFFELARPIEQWNDMVHFRIARDQATRLREYQQRFLVPMLRAVVRSGLGDVPGAIAVLSGVTGFHIGVGELGTPAGMVRHPDAFRAKRVVAGRLRPNDPLGDRPYTARLMYDRERRLDGPFSLTPQTRNFSDVLTADPPILHPLEERYARIVQADALLAWAEMLYRSDDPASLERARELYKAVLFLHGEDPGTSAYLPPSISSPVRLALAENPRMRSQLDRARLGLQQLDAGLNVYGFNDDMVPTLRYQTLVDTAHRWAAGAKSAQNDYLGYLGRVEQLDLDLLAAKALERKAQATVAIATEQIEIAKAGVVVAQKLVTNVEKLIEQKKKEIEDADSIFNQFKDYFTGMKSSVSSIVEVGKGASEGATALGVTSDAEIKATAKTLGKQALTGTGVAGGLAVVGGFGAFAVLSTMTLQGMADAAIKREDQLKALEKEALPAVHAAVQVQERYVTIARLQGQIAVTDLTYARDLVTYQNERFLNRDFWDALAGVARRSLHRYLDLAGQAAWFAERALAYELGAPIRVVGLGYFDPRMRDIGGVDRLTLDLAELEAVRLGAARVTVPITRTYSLARDLPLAFGALKRTGRCTFTLTDDDLLASHPGTFAHRIRAVEVIVDTPGTVVRPRGILTNRGFSLLRRTPGTERVPLLRFADAYPVSEFRVRRNNPVHSMPGEQLLPFEGTAFTTTWSLELPPAANPVGLARVTDVHLAFDLRAAYDAGRRDTAPEPSPTSRSLFVSALSVDTQGLASLRTPDETAKIRFALDELPVPRSGKITNLAVLVPGVDSGRFSADLRFGHGDTTTFRIDEGIAMSNAGVLGDGDPDHARPLNAAIGGSAARPAELEIRKGDDAANLAEAHDVLLWVEYELVE